MIDWVKFGATHPTPEILREKLNFTRPVNTRTGEIQGTYDVAYIQIYESSDAAMKLKLFPSGRLTVSGSLHKFLHGVNFTDFGFYDICNSIETVCNTLYLSPGECKIIGMEYGVNIKTSFKPDDFFKRLVTIKYHPFNSMTVENGSGRDCYFSDWGAKIYDKGKQYGLDYNLLRIEKKVTNARLLPKMKIDTLASLTRKDNLSLLASDLLTMFEQIIINDFSVNLSTLTGRKQLAISHYSNPLYWRNLTRFAAPKAKSRFEDFLNKYGNESYKKIVKKLVQDQTLNLIGNSRLLASKTAHRRQQNRCII